MPETESFSGSYGLLAIILLVLANGFFVAAEFALVAVRHSRVVELASSGNARAKALQRALETLDAHLAATQLGITISSLALGWIGEPALAHILQPALQMLPEDWATAGAHSIAIAISFAIITALHIVIGELAPKSLALQRSEQTALWVVYPLSFFLFVLRPAIVTLNGIGNLILKMFGLHTGTHEQSIHSPEELKLLIGQSQKAGVLQREQQEVVARTLTIGTRKIGDIMTPRLAVEWIDADDEYKETLRVLRECRHERILVGRSSIDEPIGVVAKKDLIDQILDGEPLDPLKAMEQPYFIHETASIFKVLEHFKKSPVRMAAVVNEYGTLQGIVTQTDLLEAIAGDLPSEEDDHPKFVKRPDGSFMIDASMPAFEAFEILGIKAWPSGDFHTIAGFVLAQIAQVPKTGQFTDYKGWRFEVVEMDGLRIDKITVRHIK